MCWSPKATRGRAGIHHRDPKSAPVRFGPSPAHSTRMTKDWHHRRQQPARRQSRLHQSFQNEQRRRGGHVAIIRQNQSSVVQHPCSYDPARSSAGVAGKAIDVAKSPLAARRATLNRKRDARLGKGGIARSKTTPSPVSTTLHTLKSRAPGQVCWSEVSTGTFKHLHQWTEIVNPGRESAMGNLSASCWLIVSRATAERIDSPLS